MSRDPRYDVLFEPVQIGPVTARNRFYQVPHCAGMGHREPSASAAMRAMKAEGGWAVVCTEECDIHPASEFSPYAEARLWDERDLPALARLTEAVHRHGALAGIELAFNGAAAPNRLSREIPLAPSDSVVETYDPLQARAMDKSDIKNLRRWHRAAALRAREAGFDLVYVYAGHDLGLPMHFLSRRHNRRSDEYGGSLENRTRLLRELLEDTKEAVGDRCAVVLRLAVDEGEGEEGLAAAEEGRAIVELLAEPPDLWDVNISGWSRDSQTARFGPEGFQEDYIRFVKQVTGKPVVGVGRFTSPDAMVSQIRRGILDLIGAARPSIADPFLPRKIEEGRPDEIRECIGCNICVSGDNNIVPLRCTQNPTMGEEWRRGWHPESLPAKGSDSRILVVGAGPAGLECALAAGKRGYAVTLAEAGRELGGRVTLESRLPGLATWARVRDHRLTLLDKLPNVEIYRESRLEAADVLEFGFEQVVVATGARWRRDGVGRSRRTPLTWTNGDEVLTPDDLLAGRTPAGPVLIFDDDHYYLGGVLAEKLRSEGLEVTLATPAPDVSHWTHNTLEQNAIQRRLLELGVTLMPQRSLAAFVTGTAELACVFTGRREPVAAASLVLVTARLPEDGLFRDLDADRDALSAAGTQSLQRVGDCLAPGTIAAAVYGGHRAARALDGKEAQTGYFQREVVSLSPDWPPSAC